MDKGVDRFVLGINYWPRRVGVDMWKEWAPSEIAAELSQVKEMGFQAVRIFLLWEDFQPSESEISEAAIARFDELLQMAKDRQLKLIPTFFVGNMSGEVWDVPWRKNRSFYVHPAVLNSQISLLRFFAQHYKAEEGILFWDLSNEPDLGFEAPSAEAATRWNKAMYQELKRGDSLHPVTIGLHQGSFLEDNRFRPQDLAPFNDFMCMHAYPIYTPLCPDSPDSLRTTYWASFLCKLTSALSGKPTLMEELGVSSQLASEELSRRYYESVVFSLVANGTKGILPWCYSDFTEGQRKPYDATPYEVGFGVTSAEGRLKPSGEVLMKLARILVKVEIGSLRSEAAPAAILVPRRYHSNPDKEIKAEVFTRALFSSFILAKQAGLEVDLVGINQELGSYKMIFLPAVPSRAAVTASDWQKLFGYVQGGGFIYASYHGVAAREMEAIFGIEPQFAPTVAAGEMTLLSTGIRGLPDEISFRAVRSKRLKLRERGEVWMRDDRGDAALTFNRVGKGGAFFCGYPLELYLSYLPEVHWGSQAYQIYQEMAQEAKCTFAPSRGWPEVESKIFWDSEKSYLLLVNHQGKRVDLDLSERMGPVYCRELLSQEVVDPRLSLGPNEARFLEIAKGLE